LMSITLINYCCFHKSDNQTQQKKTQENYAESLSIESCCKRLNEELQNWVHITNCRETTNMKMMMWRWVNNNQ
jgi:hypothetical protein